MQVPKRKPGKYSHEKVDTHITQEKYDQLKLKLDKLKKQDQPKAIAEVEELARLGDFSENAGYQIAKGRLRAINQKILEVGNFLNSAIIIKPKVKSDVVELGSQVTIEILGDKKTYTILGATEADPIRGIISHQSPLGEVLMNKKVGDKINFRPTAGKTIECLIVEIK